VPQVVFSLVILLLGAGFIRLWKPAGIPQVILAAIALAIAYALGYWRWFASPKQRSIVNNTLRNLVTRLKLSISKAPIDL